MLLPKRIKKTWYKEKVNDVIKTNHGDVVADSIDKKDLPTKIPVIKDKQRKVLGRVEGNDVSLGKGRIIPSDPERIAAINNELRKKCDNQRERDAEATVLAHELIAGPEDEYFRKDTNIGKYVGSYKKEELEEPKVNDLILNEIANDLLDLYHDNFVDIPYIMSQLDYDNYQLLPRKVVKDIDIYKIAYEGDLKKDGYEKCFLYLPPYSSIKLHTHTNDVEEYTVLQGTLNVNGVECSTSRCLLGESHCVNSSNKPIIIKTLKISRDLIEKEYNESLLRRKVKAKKLTFTMEK